MDDLTTKRLTDDEAAELIHEWSGDEINRVLHDLWSAALDSQSASYVNDEGEVGKLSENEYIRVATIRMRRARAELDRLYGKASG